MRRPASVPVLVSALALLLAVPAVAGNGPYRELRAQHPEIASAVASMPASSLNSTLDRISSLLVRPELMRLEDGHSAELTSQTVRQITSIVRNLERDLETGMPSLDVAERLVILQVVELVAFERLVGLHEDQPWTDCGAAPDCANAPVLVSLDRVAQIVARSVREGVGEWRAAHGLAPGAEQRAVTPTTLDAWTHDILDECGLGIGVESIDG
jgi:hypothetical protein